MGLRFRWRSATTLPVEGDGLRPDALAGLTPVDVARLTIAVGNAQAEVGDLFEIESDAETGPDTLQLDGDLRPVVGLGRGLAAGSIVIDGDAGDELGLGMAGGSIVVRGSAGRLAGAEMAGGLLRVQGDAGDDLGAARPGARLGMRDGLILVDGNAGEGAGFKMRRGLIAVAGGLGPFAGRAMIAGTIVGLGPFGDYPGLGMKRGTIVAAGGGRPRLAPSFAAAGAYRFPFLGVYADALRRAGFPVPAPIFAGAFDRYNGDRADGGQGEILVATAAVGDGGTAG